MQPKHPTKKCFCFLTFNKWTGFGPWMWEGTLYSKTKKPQIMTPKTTIFSFLFSRKRDLNQNYDTETSQIKNKKLFRLSKRSERKRKLFCHFFPNSWPAIWHVIVWLIYLMQRNVDGKNYYTFEYQLTSPNFSRTAFATIAIGNGMTLPSQKYSSTILYKTSEWEKSIEPKSLFPRCSQYQCFKNRPRG